MRRLSQLQAKATDDRLRREEAALKEAADGRAKRQEGVLAKAREQLEREAAAAKES